MSKPDNVIRFPGQKQPDNNEAKTDDIPVEQMTTPPPALNATQQKAMQVVLSGMSFVVVGIQPTDNGADFFTAVDGEPSDVLDALPHLEGVIERAIRRKGW